MGYRSDVRIATTMEGYEQICKKVDELSQDGKSYPLIGTKRTPEVYEDFKGCVVFGWDWIKWYDGMYKDVDDVIAALEFIESKGIPYEFCRTGENYEDIEFENHDDDGILDVHLSPEVSIVTYY